MLMVVATKETDPRLAVKLVDFVCPLTADFWARNSCGRHVIMAACNEGAHPSVLLRLIKWARRCSLNVALPMSIQDLQGLDAVQLAIQRGHGALASCLLEKRDPATHDHLLCLHYPLKVLELAIESMNEQCAREVLDNKRVVSHLKPGKAERLNLITRWTQRQTPNKRLYNIFTCVSAAVLQDGKYRRRYLQYKPRRYPPSCLVCRSQAALTGLHRPGSGGSRDAANGEFVFAAQGVAAD